MLELKVINDSITRTTYRCGDYIINQRFVYGSECYVNVSTNNNDLPQIGFDSEKRAFTVEYIQDQELFNYALEVVKILTEKFCY